MVLARLDICPNTDFEHETQILPHFSRHPSSNGTLRFKTVIILITEILKLTFYLISLLMNMATSVMVLMYSTCLSFCDMMDTTFIKDGTPTLEINEVGMNKKNPDLTNPGPFFCWPKPDIIKKFFNIQPSMHVFQLIRSRNKVSNPLALPLTLYDDRNPFLAALSMLKFPKLMWLYCCCAVCW
jgi:hypothetical protein